MSNKVKFSKPIYVLKKDEATGKTVLENNNPVVEKIIVTASKRFGMWDEKMVAKATCVDVANFDYEKGKKLAETRLNAALAELRIKSDTSIIANARTNIEQEEAYINRTEKKLKKHRANLEAALEEEANILASFEDE